MKEKKYFKVLSFLYGVAAAISVYLVYNHYTLMNGDMTHSICNINNYLNCDTVNASRFSKFLGVPVSVWGLMYYLSGAIMATAAALSAYAIREAALILVPTSVFSVLLSIALALISVIEIHALCVFCSILHVLNILILGFVYLGSKAQFKNYKKELKGCEKNRLNFFLILAAVISVGTLTVTSQLHKPIPFDSAIFVDKIRSATITKLEPAQNAAVMGAPLSKALIQIVEFSDFECPFCGLQGKEVARILRMYGDRIQIVFRNFPLDMSCNPLITHPMHQNACGAAKAAWCSNKMGIFTNYHHTLFQNQKNFSRESFISWAKNEKADGTQFESCLESAEAKAAVQADINLGTSLKITSTPTLFINGKRFEGLLTLEAVEYLLTHRDLLP